MAKDAYYFSHDYDPLGDPKMQAMVAEFGGLGYGIFWRIAEMLHADGTHKLALKPYVFKSIATQMKTTSEYVEDFINRCINEFELLTLIEAEQSTASSKRSNNDDASCASFFGSNRVNRNITDKASKTKQKSDSGKVGGIKSGESRRTKKNEAPLQEIEAEQSTASRNEAKERKGKESIEIQRQTQLCPEMVKIFKSVYPKYPSNQETDYPACLQVAYKIADSKEWPQESVLNGKLPEVLKIWKFIVEFSATDPWFSTRSISDFNKEYQRLVQKITNKKEEKKEFKQQSDAPPLKRLS